jgi:hypothetical protein
MLDAMTGCSGFDPDGVPIEEVCTWEGEEAVPMDGYVEVDGTFILADESCRLHLLCEGELAKLIDEIMEEAAIRGPIISR